jgi:hypothetical protein
MDFKKVGNPMDMTPELESKILYSIDRLKQLRDEGSLSETQYKLHLWKYLSRLQQQIEEDVFEKLVKQAFDDKD